MRLGQALTIAGRAARTNLLPGLLLQAIMVVFLSLFLLHDGTRIFLSQVGDLKQEAGYGFAFVSYLISAALLPEILRVVFFQGCRPGRANLWSFFTAAPAWGLMGIIVDLLYRSQAQWFGTGNDWQTILVKVALDQFLFSPFFSNPVLVGYFSWRDAGFRAGALPEILRPDRLSAKVFSVQVAAWCIWIPGVSLVYFMPSDLQVPVASLIQCFWVLVFTLINKTRRTL